MVAKSSESLVPAVSVDRRPAIWPWLVMPLVTLALFYGLYKLKQSQGSYDTAVQTTASAPVEAGNP